ncbi:Elongator complex protein 4 [Phytophthora citrophthora]|uniref:Elongator complex protein 4 n=1 Tax=Phytophthora citrophthora TaxID=4793 RepID=A0AAD9LMU3_9STRA|nr:Elongator complex protein 4 [Phytophthora citrophthora]
MSMRRYSKFLDFYLNQSKMSFRRKTPTSSLRSGTKPFLNGQTLVSSGLSELDTALGGGLMLGTLNMVETQSDSSLDVGAGASDSMAVDLLRYFVAEGVAGGQRVAMVAPDALEFVKYQLPLELSIAQRQVKQQIADNDKENPLTIAWQYAKYEQKQQTKDRFCHSFDLSKTMHGEMLTANEPIAIDLLSWAENTVGEVYERLYLTVEEIVTRQKENGGQVLRLGLIGLGSPLLGPADTSHMAALFKFSRRLRSLVVQSKGTVCLVALGSDVVNAFPDPFLNELRHVSDTVLALNSFAGSLDLLPDELQEFQGSLTLQKLPRVHALACHAPSNTRFGVKRGHRKLKIEKFHLPPEGSRSSNSSSCGGNTSSPGHNGTDPLAF